MRRVAEQRIGLSRSIGLPGRDDVSLLTAIAFEIALLMRVAGWSTSVSEQDLEKAFNDFTAAASPVSSSYRAHAMWRQLRRYEIVPVASMVASQFRARLENMGVRRYWGPRS